MTRTTYFRILVQERRWTTYEAFLIQFQRAGRELARRDGDARLATLPLSERQFMRWMTGDIKGLPRSYTCRILEHLFGHPVEALFNPLPPPEGDALPDEEALAGTVAGATPSVAEKPSLQTWESQDLRAHRVANDMASRTVSTIDVQVIRSMLTSLTASDHQFGGGHARALATDYLQREVQPRLHSQMDDAVHREMFRVAAEFAVRVAWMHFDVGQRSHSRRFMAFALASAQESEDLTLMSWVLSMRGLQCVWEDNIEAAISYTESAVAMARHAPWKARAFVSGKAALALSMTGDEGGTLATLGRVRDYFDKAGNSNEPNWSSIYDLAYVRDEEGNCFRNLALGEQAVLAEEDAMKLRGSGGNGYARLRAFSLSVQALGYVQAGEIEQACVAGTDLVSMSPAFSSQRVLSRLRDVLAAVRPFAELSVVRDLQEAARPALLPFLPPELS